MIAYLLAVVFVAFSAALAFGLMLCRAAAVGDHMAKWEDE